MASGSAISASRPVLLPTTADHRRRGSVAVSCRRRPPSATLFSAHHTLSATGRRFATIITRRPAVSAPTAGRRGASGLLPVDGGVIGAIRSRGCEPLRRAVVVGDGSTDAEAPPCSTERTAEFRALAVSAGVKTSVGLLSSGPPRYSGLFSEVDAVRGQVMMEVPPEVCLTLDYAVGLSLPSDGQWPTLVEELDREEPLPWDLLLALALVDAELGDGGAFWGAYVRSILPTEEEISIPFCLPEALLPEFQHSELQSGAEAQKERMRSLFPKLMAVTSADALPSLQRMYACVRSRAFKGSDDCFSFVPFLDAANHAMDPNADFRRDESGTWQLVALKPIAIGEEVCISYTGPEGYSNRRLMVQYGFVPEGGNPADRIDLTADLGLSAEQLEGKQLSGSKLQAAVGPDLASMISGENMCLYAAIRSFPMIDDEQEPLAHTESFAKQLLEGCKAALAEFPTSLEEDAALMASLSPAGPDRALAAAIAYRLQRKQLLSCGRGILERYLTL